jgi:hypothetical protein
MTNTLLQTLCQLPHRGAATAYERAAAKLLVEELRQRGASARLEPFSAPKTYVTIRLVVTLIISQLVKMKFHKAAQINTQDV